MKKERGGKQKNGMTLDGLARMVQAGFAETATKADLRGVCAEIDAVRKDLGAEIGLVKLDLAEVKRDVKEMKENSSELFTKLDKFIELYEEMRMEHRTLAKQVARLEERMAKLEARR